MFVDRADLGMLRLWVQPLRAVRVGYPKTASVPAVAAQGHPTYRDLTRLPCVVYRNLRDRRQETAPPHATTLYQSVTEHTRNT